MDNTLYPRSSGLLAHLDQQINAYLRDVLKISEDAVDGLRQRYVREYGTTLRGCQIEYGVDPVDYVTKTHNIDQRQFVAPDEKVERALRELPGTKMVFSNSPMLHVASTLRALNLTHMFERVYTIEFLEYEGKPGRAAYDRVLTDLSADPEQCVMVEDTPANLVVPHQIGMATVLVSDDLCTRPKYVDHVVQRLPDLLQIWGRLCDKRLA